MGLQEILWGPAEGRTQQLPPSVTPKPQGEKCLEGTAGQVLQKTGCCGRRGSAKPQRRARGPSRSPMGMEGREGPTEPRHRGLKGHGKPGQEDTAWRTQELLHHSLRFSPVGADGWLRTQQPSPLTLRDGHVALSMGPVWPSRLPLPLSCTHRHAQRSHKHACSVAITAQPWRLP